MLFDTFGRVTLSYPPRRAMWLTAHSFSSCYRDGEVHVLIPRHDSVKGFVTRGIAFSRCGRFFVSGGDDKIATLWACSDWQIIKTL